MVHADPQIFLAIVGDAIPRQGFWMILPAFSIGAALSAVNPTEACYERSITIYPVTSLPDSWRITVSSIELIWNPDEPARVLMYSLE